MCIHMCEATYQSWVSFLRSSPISFLRQDMSLEYKAHCFGWSALRTLWSPLPLSVLGLQEHAICMAFYMGLVDPQTQPLRLPWEALE